MGCFGYICRGCNTPIRGDCHKGGEYCVLIHVRDGKEIGRAIGHYDKYGRVVEDKIFRNDEIGNPNNHSEICKSDFGLKNSFHFEGKRKYNGSNVNINEYYFMRNIELIKNDLNEKDYNLEKEWFTLPECINGKDIHYSGIVAWHKVCYDKSLYKDDLTPSYSDPNQSWGQIREKFK